MVSRAKMTNQYPFFGYISDGKKIQFNHQFYKQTQKTFYEIAREIIETFIKTQSYKLTLDKILEKYPEEEAGQRRNEYCTHIPLGYSNLIYWINHPYLRGHLKIRKQIINNNHVALISPEESKVIETIKQSFRFTPKNGHELVNPFAGLMCCPCCQKMMRLSLSKPKQPYYYRYFRCTNRQCSSNVAFKLEKVIQDIIPLLCREASVIANWISQTRIHSAEVFLLNSQIQQLQNLNDTDVKPVLEQKIRTLSQLQQRETMTQINQLTSYLSMPEFWFGCSPEQLNYILREVIDFITYDACDRLVVRISDPLQQGIHKRSLSHSTKTKG